MERYKQLVETPYTEPKEEEILGTFLQLENTGEQDLAPVAPKQKKKPKCPPESDKNQIDIRSYFAATPRQATILIEFWTLVFYLCFLTFFLKRV